MGLKHRHAPSTYPERLPAQQRAVFYRLLPAKAGLSERELPGPAEGADQLSLRDEVAAASPTWTD